MSYACLSLHTVAADQLLPIFLHYPQQKNRASDPDVQLPFKFSGGFGLQVSLEATTVSWVLAKPSNRSSPSGWPYRPPLYRLWHFRHVYPVLRLSIRRSPLRCSHLLEGHQRHLSSRNLPNSLYRPPSHLCRPTNRTVFYPHNQVLYHHLRLSLQRNHAHQQCR